LNELSHVAHELADYQPFHAASADLLAKSGRKEEALMAYDKAITMAVTAADAAFLVQRRTSLSREN
jgi:predicted RNA polymerase sigma factor